MNKDDFMEMTRDWQADNTEYDDLIIDEPEIDEDTGKWEAIAHDGRATYVIADDGNGNIMINYLGTK